MPPSPSPPSRAITLALSVAAILIGVVAWEAAVPAGTRKEAWDLPVYWQIAYPMMVAGSFVLGILGPSHPVRWGLLVGLGQGVWSLIVTSLQKGISNLLPLGLIMFAILSVPCIAAAWLGAWLGRRLGF
jgi:hypothetical protein